MKLRSPRRRECSILAFSMLSLIALGTEGRALHAQIGESFFEKVTDLNLYGTCWAVKTGSVEGDCAVGNAAYGIELMWRLAPTDSASKWLTEFSAGYGQSQRFRSTTEGLDLRGTVREIPAVSIYSTYQARSNIQPYIGVRTGIIRLQNMQIAETVRADTVLTYVAAAEALQLGGLGGISVSLFGPLLMNADVSYHYRRFPSVQWGNGSGVRYPTRYPRELDFSGWSYSVGTQLRVGKKQ